MRRIPPITALAALTLLLAALFAMPAAATAASAGPGSHRHVVDLGTLGGPENQSEATAVNDHGEVVGWSTPDTNCTCVHAFLWRHGKMTDLMPLLRANDINDHGVIVGVGVTDTGADHAFRWAHGKATDLGTLGGDSSEATAINNHGQIVGTSTTADGQYHSFLWANGQMTDLAPLGASDINDHGQIVGGYRPPGADNPHAFLYQLRNGKLTDLGTLYGWLSEATAVNQRGQVVGYVGVPTLVGANSAFLWSKGHMTDLGTMGGDGSQALGINDHGTVVGWAGSRGFVWRNGTMTALSVLTAGGSFGGSANDINNHGVIVGSSGVHTATYDTYHAVLWR
jgi:probable HAF family extracellular repeat protein